jgi:Mrp family chromosome partitioning ATPase
MSRVAEALRKARQGETRTERSVVDAAAAADGIGRDIGAVVVPWDMEPTIVPTSSRDLHSHQADAPTHTPRAIDHGRSTHGVVADEHAAEYVELVQRLFRPATGDPVARLVAFATVGSDDAPRSVALEVARTLARHGGGNVCIVDASLGAAALHAQVVLPSSPGVSDGLLNGRSVESLAVIVEDNLWMVPGGPPLDAWPARLPEALTGAMGQLASRFDFVLVEGGAFAREFGMPTLMTVAPLTDGVVLVLEAERTRRDVAADAVTRLRATGVTVLGAVLTGSQRRNG